MYNQTTFSFKGTNVTDIIPDIMIPDIRIPLRPEVRKRKMEIPGRDGAWNFGPGEKRDFNIEVDFTINATDNADLRSKMRSLSSFLDGSGELIFTDDPTQTYQAEVYSQISTSKRVFTRVQSGTIIFECQA